MRGAQRMGWSGRCWELCSRRRWTLRRRMPPGGRCWIGPRSERHARMYSDHGHQALLHLRHASLGKYRLGIASVEDVAIALRELPRVLGEVCRVEIEWSERDKKFVKG